MDMLRIVNRFVHDITLFMFYDNLDTKFRLLMSCAVDNYKHQIVVYLLPVK